MVFKLQLLRRAALAGVFLPASAVHSCADCLASHSRPTAEDQGSTLRSEVSSLQSEFDAARMREEIVASSALREEVVRSCRTMNAIGINQGTSGNVSARVPGGFLISPSGLAYHLMTAEDVVFVDMDGNYWGEHAPSSEWKFHLDVYRARPEAKAIVHAHPTFLSLIHI
eukprot:TRINITY_DN56135_c0_g1_i1.p1 TRINITY_DN56135_c0_g1~~TRINITY_DN56135_c0_g1_i1.p1  ORF type:complete len:169 (+),score=37.00 TRINITY_DN56135_c0_g1_i1:81-587(+)